MRPCKRTYTSVVMILVMALYGCEATGEDHSEVANQESDHNASDEQLSDAPRSEMQAQEIESTNLGSVQDGRYALLVGVSDYPGVENDLVGPRVDVAQIEQVLLDRFHFQKANILTLLDNEATGERLLAGFREHLTQAGTDGTALIFYSGHGTQVDNVGVLPPQDPEADGKDEALVLWADSKAGGLQLVLDDELGLLADELPSRKVLFILDSCFSGTGTRLPVDGYPKRLHYRYVEDQIEGSIGIESVVSKGSSKLIGETGGIAEALGQPENHILLAAAGEDELAIDLARDDMGGLFTYLLVEELQAVSETATFSSVVRNLQKTLRDLAEQGDVVLQTPQLEGRQQNARVLDYLD